MASEPHHTTPSSSTTSVSHRSNENTSSTSTTSISHGSNDNTPSTSTIFVSHGSNDNGPPTSTMSKIHGSNDNTPSTSTLSVSQGSNDNTPSTSTTSISHGSNDSTPPTSTFSVSHGSNDNTPSTSTLSVSHGSNDNIPSTSMTSVSHGSNDNTPSTNLMPICQGTNFEQTEIAFPSTRHIEHSVDRIQCSEDVTAHMRPIHVHGEGPVQIGGINTIYHSAENTPQVNQQIIDETNQQLETYKAKEGKLFVESQAFKQCETKLAEKGHVTIFGAPGDGKTTMGLEVLYRVQFKTKRKAIIISNKVDWGKVDLSSKSGQELIILFDDMLGKFVLDESLKNFWFSLLPKLLSFVQNGKIQIIITCRESIFCTAKNELESFNLFTTGSRIYLSGTNCVYLLDAETKFNIIKKHVELAGNIEICDTEIKQVLSPSSGQQCRIWVGTLTEISKKSCVGFMQMCKVFVSAPAYHGQGAEFFDHAVDFLVREIDRLRESKDEFEKYNYCTLACVLLKQGLNIDQIDEDKILKKIAESCRIGITSTATMESEIKLAVERLTSSYLIKKKGIYQFQHNSWVESVFKSFAKSDPSLLIKYCKFGLIEDLIITKGAREKSVEFCELGNSQKVCLFERLVSEVVAGYVRRSVCHQCFTDRQFTEEFCRWVDNAGREQKETVLLSVEPDRRLWQGGNDESILYWSARRADRSLVAWVVDGFSKLRSRNRITRLKSEDEIRCEMSKALISACYGGNLSVVMWLLSQREIEVRDRCIVGAAFSGNIGVVNTLLNLNDKNFSSDALSRAVVLACEHHHIDVLEFLLAQSGVDRGVSWGECLIEASVWGNIDAVTKLMNYGQFTSNDLSQAAWSVCIHNHIDVFDLIIAQPEVDRGVAWGECLIEAAVWGSIDVVTKLINYGQFKCDDLSLAVLSACYHHHVDVFDLIIAQPGVDRGMAWGWCLSGAAKWGNIAVVTKLMNYGQFTSDDLSGAAFSALYHRHIDIFNMLITSSGVDRGNYWIMCLREAAECEKRGDACFAKLLRKKGYLPYV